MTGQYEGGGNFGELTETVEEPRVKRVYLQYLVRGQK